MKKPHVLLINVDHWPGALLGASDHPHILTPTLNELAASGVHYRRAYSAVPTCIPARREIMTGTAAKTHGDRIFNETLPMDPNLPTMADTFSHAGYQTFAVGKLHVYPQRNRIGFNDALIHEEGRHHLGGGKDDYELFLQREGYAGQELTHAMGNNHYCTRPWHLPEFYHPTNWTTREMCRQIQRRDPTKPGFWYCSYAAPHPPLTPPDTYFSLYKDMEIDVPVVGTWAEDDDSLPYAIKSHKNKYPSMSPVERDLARKAFYAQCTYIDHQIRLLIGTLREEHLLDDTILMFISDHGDMLGNHRLWAKSLLFEYAVHIPMILSLPPSLKSYEINGMRDDRLAVLCDVMPTLLELCDIPIPDSVEGRSLLSGKRREYIYGEHYENEDAVRMVLTEKYKLIWYPVGNRFQLFDISNDPMEEDDISSNSNYSAIMSQLQDALRKRLYGTDMRWLENQRFVGEPEIPFKTHTDRTLRAQRGWR